MSSSEFIILCAVSPFVAAFIMQGLKNLADIIPDPRPESVRVVYVPKVVYKERLAYNRNPKPTTSDKVKAQTLYGLCGLGMSTSEARLLIAKQISKNTYNDPQELIKDCVASL